MRNLSQERLLVIIFILFSFLENQTVYTIGGIEVKSLYLLWPLYILLSLYILFKKGAIDRIVLAFFMLLLFVGLYSFLITDFSKTLVIKQILLLFATFFASIYIYYFVKNKPVNFLKIYFEISYLFAFLGIIQIFGFMIGIKPLYNFSYLGLNMGNLSPNNFQLQSIFIEPSFFAYGLGIAIYLSILKVFKFQTISNVKNYKALVIIIASLLTLSLVVYVFILFSLLYIFISGNSIIKVMKYSILFFTLLIVSLILLIKNNPVFQTKIDQTVSLIKLDKIYNPQKYNLSSYALISNLKIAENITHKNAFGAGLGNYEKAYDKFIFVVSERTEFSEKWQLNKKDGNSLLIRMWVELGPILTSFFIVLLLYFKLSPFKYKRISGNYFNSLLILNDSIFILILVRFLRQGHYTNFCFILFLMIYFSSAISIKKQMKSNEL